MVVFLGDGAANGCQDELDDFFKALANVQKEKPVFFVIGNHDYLANGITSTKALRKTSCGANNPPRNKLALIKQVHAFNARNLTHTKFIKSYQSNVQSGAIDKHCGDGATPMHERAGCYYSGVVTMANGGELLLTDSSDYYGINYTPSVLMTQMKSLYNLLKSQAISTPTEDADKGMSFNVSTIETSKNKVVLRLIVKALRKFVKSDSLTANKVKEIIKDIDQTFNQMTDFAAIRGFTSYVNTKSTPSQIKWLENHVNPKAAFRVLLSHYPTDNYTPLSKKTSRIGAVMLKKGANIWLSAHTHKTAPKKAIFTMRARRLKLFWRDVATYQEYTVGSVLEHNPHGLILNIPHSAPKTSNYQLVSLVPDETTCAVVDKNLSKLNEQDLKLFLKNHGMDQHYQNAPKFEDYHQAVSKQLSTTINAWCQKNAECASKVRLCLGSMADQLEDAAD